MEPLTIAEMVRDLACPICSQNSLRAEDHAASKEPDLRCTLCERKFPNVDGIVDFLLVERLDQTNQNEIAGNVYDLTDSVYIQKATNKQSWSKAYSHSLLYALGHTEAMMRPIVTEKSILVSLGSGTGFELKVLCQKLKVARVYSSDISHSAVSLVPVSLRNVEVKAGLFVSEFLNVPLVRRSNHIGLVFQALHHTSDIHEALAILLQRFEALVIVEPTTNWLVECLARFGLAKRVEYSGLTPSWLDLKKATAIAAIQGFVMQTRTWWEIPPYLSKRLDRIPPLRSFVIMAVNLISLVTNWFRFGSMSCVVLMRNDKS